MPALGMHISTGKGFPAAVESARELGVEAVQIFTTNPSSWRAPMPDPGPASAFTRALRDAGVRTVVSHANYLINLAGPDESMYRKSVTALADEYRRGAIYGLDHVIVHIGSHKGSGLDQGYTRIVDAVASAMDAVPADGSPRLLLENAAGTGDHVGGRFEELAELLQRLHDYEARVGICFDTAHAHSAGYDMAGPEAAAKTIAELDQAVGLDHIYVIHANDTEVEAGAKRDKHWHIGEGQLGFDTFAYLLSHGTLSQLPFILETPGEEAIDGRRNLESLRSLL